MSSQQVKENTGEFVVSDIREGEDLKKDNVSSCGMLPGS